MTWFEILKRALEWDPEDYSNMPDYSDVLDRLGLTEDDDPFEVQACIECELAAQNAEPGADGDTEGGAGETAH